MKAYNFLPWRDALNAHRKRKNVFRLTTAGVAALALALLLVMVVDHQISIVEAENDFIKKKLLTQNNDLGEIKDLASRKQTLIEKIDLLNGLQNGTTDSAMVFAELSAIVPRGIVVSSVNRSESATITGRAQANGNIADLMRAIERSSVLRDPELISIATKKGKQLNTFKLEARTSSL
jgi:type IV pilus assembly protein PilN